MLRRYTSNILKSGNSSHFDEFTKEVFTLRYSINESYGLELTRENFADMAGLFGGLEQHLSIQGVLSGSITGRVFVANDRQTALLCNKSEFYIGGNPYNSPFIEEVSRLLRLQLLPELNNQGSLDYVLYYPSDEPWKEDSRASTRGTRGSAANT